ncbi:hypothetical protein OG985_28475 [Streptomyces sp. NBC_00289]
MKTFGAVVAAAFIATLIAGAAWVWTSAPCGLWTFSKAGDMPARCLPHH